MPDRPENCNFLTQSERTVAAVSLAREHKGVGISPSSFVAIYLPHLVGLQRKSNTQTYPNGHLQYPHHNLCPRLPLFVSIAVQSISLFMPTILNDMGYTAIQAQLHSVPPYVTACALSIAVAFMSDRTRRRGIYLAGFATLSVIGLALLRSHSIKSLGVNLSGSDGCMLWRSRIPILGYD